MLLNTDDCNYSNCVSIKIRIYCNSSLQYTGNNYKNLEHVHQRKVLRELSMTYKNHILTLSLFLHSFKLYFLTDYFMHLAPIPLLLFPLTKSISSIFLSSNFLLSQELIEYN